MPAVGGGLLSPSAPGYRTIDLGLPSAKRVATARPLRERRPGKVSSTAALADALGMPPLLGTVRRYVEMFRQQPALMGPGMQQELKEAAVLLSTFAIEATQWLTVDDVLARNGDAKEAATGGDDDHASNSAIKPTFEQICPIMFMEYSGYFDEPTRFQLAQTCRFLRAMVKSERRIVYVTPPTTAAPLTSAELTHFYQRQLATHDCVPGSSLVGYMPRCRVALLRLRYSASRWARDCALLSLAASIDTATCTLVLLPLYFRPVWYPVFCEFRQIRFAARFVRFRRLAFTQPRHIMCFLRVVLGWLMELEAYENPFGEDPPVGAFKCDRYSQITRAQLSRWLCDEVSLVLIPNCARESMHSERDSIADSQPRFLFGTISHKYHLANAVVVRDEAQGAEMAEAAHEYLEARSVRGSMGMCTHTDSPHCYDPATCMWKPRIGTDDDFAFLGAMPTTIMIDEGQ